MICVISQPRLFPGLHYLHRLMLADVFCVFDTVQFNPRHEENRARLKGPDGPLWLSAPMTKAGRDQRIVETRPAADRTWVRKALRTLEGCYGQSPNYAEFAPRVAAVLEAEHATLTDLDLASWQIAREALGLSCRIVRASDLPVEGKGPDYLLDLTRHLGCDTYVSGGFGREYLVPAQFRAQGVDVQFHEYTCAQYPQRYGPFEPYLSYLDALFNAGLDPRSVTAGGRLVPAE